MFGQSTRTRDRHGTSEGEAREPLLSSSQEDLVAEERVIFAAGDDDLDEDGALDSPKDARAEHSVRFQEDVQVIGPPLRSTIHSREAGVHVSSLTTFNARNNSSNPLLRI